MAAISISTVGHVTGLAGHTDILVLLAQGQARIAAAAVTALTDSSGGVADAQRRVLGAKADLAEVAASGTNLADKATTETNLTAVKDGLAEVAARALAVAARVGAAGYAWNGGGAAANGTVEAIAVAVTGAATGVRAEPTNATILALDRAASDLGALVNRLAIATGTEGVRVLTGRASRPETPAIAVSGGVAAAPGVAKAAVDAKLVLLRNDVATLAAAVNRARAGIGNVGVAVVP